MSPSSTRRKLRVWLSTIRKSKARAAEQHDTNSTQATPAPSTQPLRTVEPRTLRIKACAEFNYTPIGEFSIRIITLQSGSGDDPLKCTLFTYDLEISYLSDKVGPYETLSYVWGDASKQREILCDGASLSITESLYDALKAVRYPSGRGSRNLWADGICINQQDDEEKTSQVRLMNYIYLCGTGVLIWLGKVDPLGAMRALHIACQLAAEETEKLESIQVSDPQEAVTPSTQGRPETESYFLWFNDELNEWTIMRPLKNLLIIPHYSSNPLYLEWLGPLFEAPWFQRVWVIQEYMMSNYADVFWGNAQFGFNLLAKAAKRIRDDHWPIFTHLFEAADGLSKCHELHRIRRDWEKSSFYDLLMLSKNRQATDPRDRIFALLGLPNHDMWSNTDFPVAPDYSLSMEEVYHITAIRLLVERNAVDVLAYVRHDPQDHETWASWVPDWTCCEEIGQTSIIKKVCGYIRAVVSVPTCAICYNERYAISIRGIVVDTIDTLAADIFDRMASTDPYDCSTLSHFRKGWLHAINAFINYYQPFFSDTILANSLTTGFGPGFRRILPYLHEDVQRFLAEYRIFVKYTQERKQSCAGYSEKTNSFVNVVCNTVAQRRFFVTSKGMLGLGPEKSREGDVVAVLFGGSTPYLLRPVRNGTHWRLVGECYVYDIMEGQAVTRWQGSNEPATDFHLY